MKAQANFNLSNYFEGPNCCLFKSKSDCELKPYNSFWPGVISKRFELPVVGYTLYTTVVP